MTGKGLRIAGIAGSGMAIVVAGVALAAAPLPKTHKAYTTKGREHGVALTFVISATNPKSIRPGQAVGGSSFAISGGAVECPTAKKNKGFPGNPFVEFGFPGANLKLSHGKYGFSKTYTVHSAGIVGTPSPKTFTLNVTITGKVVSSTEIDGTFKSHGGKCSTTKPVSYKTKLSSIPVAPGQ